MNMPPKVVGNKINKKIKAILVSQGSAVVKADFAKEIEDLPVLDAFKEFLDRERKHAKKQLVSVTVFFLSIILLILILGAISAYIFLSQYNDDMKIIHNKMLDIRKETERLAKNNLSLKTKLENSRSVEETEKQLSLTLKDYSQKLDALQERIRKLNEENIYLHTSLVNMQNKIKESMLNKPKKNEEKLLKKSIPKNYSTVAFMVASPNPDKRIKWLMPISE